jgi:hypothetical protein
MAITVSEENSARKLRRSGWAHQRTFATPLKDLPRFVGAVLSGVPDLRGGTAHLETIVFEPRALHTLLVGAGADAAAEGAAVTADTPADASALLAACLACWIDFFFVPAPRPFVLYADHDERTTVLATTRSGLNAGCGPLLAAGFRELSWERSF